MYASGGVYQKSTSVYGLPISVSSRSHPLERPESAGAPVSFDEMMLSLPSGLLDSRVFAWLHLEQLLSTEFVCHVFREATLTQYEVRFSRLKDSLQQQGAIYRSINKESNFEAPLSTPEARAEPAAELESVTPDDDDWGDWEDDWGEDQTDQSEAEPIGSLSKPAIGRELEYLREPSNSGASIGWGFSVSFDLLCTELPLNRVYHQSGDPFLMDQAGLLVAGLDLQSQLDVLEAQIYKLRNLQRKALLYAAERKRIEDEVQQMLHAFQQPIASQNQETKSTGSLTQTKKRD